MASGDFAKWEWRSTTSVRILIIVLASGASRTLSRATAADSG